MCYSTESSLIAWVISVVIGCYLWNRNRKYDRWNASFIWTFSAVQLWEAGIWSSTNKSQQNFYLKLLLLTLLAQPLVQTYSGWRATGSRTLQIMTGVFLLIWFYTLYRTFTEQFYVTKGPHGHLIWHSDSGSFIQGNIPVIGILYLLGLFLALLWILPTSIPLIAIGGATILWSLLQTSTGEFDSYWCYVAVAYSITAIFV
ncbi:hypothetical protein LCGC14_1917510 [marine sediment metagenome]|uniref:Uncharacterized protein n=1 Tax=marine sediment metagenome TaxID=412755 RepID=A0A0F9FRK3_9ZZZZ